MVGIKAVLDTGFDGEICVPTDLAVTLGLELFATRLVEFADGSQKKELLFKGSVRFRGVKKDVEILLTTGEEGLVGTELLKGHVVTLDFPNEQVRFPQRRNAR